MERAPLPTVSQPSVGYILQLEFRCAFLWEGFAASSILYHIWLKLSPGYTVSSVILSRSIITIHWKLCFHAALLAQGGWNHICLFSTFSTCCPVPN